MICYPAAIYFVSLSLEVTDPNWFILENRNYLYKQSRNLLFSRCFLFFNNLMKLLIQLNQNLRSKKCCFEISMNLGGGGGGF